MSEKHKCCKEVWSGYRGHPCTKPAKVEREGQWYCLIHDPKAVVIRRAKQYAKWELQMASRRIELAAPALLEALEQILSFDGSRGTFDSTKLASAQRRAESVIAKAKGKA